MGQEQSYVSHASVASSRRYKDNYQHPITYRSSSVDFRSSDFEDKDPKRLQPRRSTDSYKSDNSSTESSGYRSGSSVYEYRSERSLKSDYYCTSLYKNDHYKEVNKELYKPVKLHKDKRCKSQLFEKDELQSARLKSYFSDTEKSKPKSNTTPKKTGIRNYTPKILSEEEQRKKLTNWI